MAIGIHSKTQLADKVESDFQRAANHRSARDKIWKSYIGDTYGLSVFGAKSVPLNGHALYARTLIHYLAANQPKVSLTTDVGPWKQHMESVEYQASRVMREQHFGAKQQRFVLDALVYSPGIMKVCQEWKRVPQGDGEYVETLVTSVENVDPSDWVFDLSASSIWNCRYTGHRFRMSVEDALANPMFKDVDPDALRGTSGTLGDDQRLFFENYDKSQPYREEFVGWEIWDKDENKLKIWPVHNRNLLLYDEPWDGHTNGPLHYLDMLDVPNHVIGLSPMCLVHDLIEAMNRALNKSINQTDLAKTIMRITGNSKGEAEAVMEAMDGQAVYADSGGVAEMLTVGGPDARTLSMVPILKDLFNWQGGNINELGGLGVSAPTAAQGKMLNEAASGMVSFMQARTQEAVRTIAEAIVQLELRDRLTTEYIPKTLPDGRTFWRTLTPEMREQIDSILLNVDIDVSSMRYQSPGDKLASMMQWWNGFALPGYQIWQQQGGEYDMQALMRMYAKYSGLSEINDVALYSMKPQPQMTGSSEPIPTRPPSTTRTSIRMDRGGESQELGGALAGQLARMEAA